MKLIEALEVLREPWPDDAAPFRVDLVCGFTPLHLVTFLAAHLRRLCADRRIEVDTGLFGDLLNTLERVEKSRPDACAIVLEWADLDPRLGLRSVGGWGPGVLEDIVATVASRIDRIAYLINRISQTAPIALCLPTLPLPPVSYAPGWRASDFDLRIRGTLSRIEDAEALGPKIRILNRQRLDLVSPLSERLDVRSEFSSGFPYKLPHASSLAELLARLVFTTAPKKGVITDLDNTMWRGILGEAGVEGISWDLGNRSQVNGLYQQMLQALAETGALIAIASKNDPGLVEEALAREDLLLDRDRIFPKEVHWRRKSESVRSILNAWNVGADSVVFVDDSPMEVAEVRQIYPEMECLVFPAEDVQAAYELLERLRDMFGKDTISDEDTLRVDSLRRSTAFKEAPQMASDSTDGDFLERVDAEITLNFVKDPADSRALELVNKTNQFNLNGKRYSEGSWEAYLKRPDTFVLVASYKDKYGPLGRVAVVAGRYQFESLVVEAWVMSCRAFSRQIEYRCLLTLFDRFQVDEMILSFQETAKNGPFRDFLTPLLAEAPAQSMKLYREVFMRRVPQLFHEVKTLVDDRSPMSAHPVF